MAKGGKRARQEKMDTRPYLRLLERIDQQYAVGQRGDMLVFLSGMNEITMLADELRAYAVQTKRWVLLLLSSKYTIMHTI